jgi:broad specificity phosphatase PhoE
MNPDKTIFYMVRHGEAQGNVEGRLMGHFDSPLTERGRQQAEQVSENLREIHFDAVYSSDLVRAHETAKTIASRRRLEVITRKALRERHCASIEGKKKDEIQELLKEGLLQFALLSTDEKMRHRFIENEESGEELVTRFITLVREIAVAYPGKSILLVTHSGLMGNFLVHLGEGEYGGMFGAAEVENGGYIKFESDGVEFKVLELHGFK